MLIFKEKLIFVEFKFMNVRSRVNRFNRVIRVNINPMFDLFYACDLEIEWRRGSKS